MEERILAAFILLTLPIERFLTLEVFGYTLRPVYAGMGLLLVLYGRQLRRAGREPVVVAAMVCSAALLSLFQASHGAWLTSALYAAWAAFTVAFFLAFVGHVTQGGNLDLWLRAYVASGALWATLALVQWFAALEWPHLAYGFIGRWPRVHGLTLEPSYFALYLLPPLFIALGLRSALAWPIAVGLALTTARTGAAGFLAGLAVLASASRGRSLLRSHAALVVVTLFLMAPTSLTTLKDAFSISLVRPPDPTEEKPIESLTVRVNVQDHASVGPRLSSWKEAWEVWKNHPWGVGVGGYGYAVPDAEEPRTHKTTNLVLEVLAETGPLGVLALLFWALWPAVGLWKERNNVQSLALLSAVVAEIITFPFFQTWWRPYLWYSWGLAYAHMRASHCRHSLEGSTWHRPICN